MAKLGWKPLVGYAVAYNAAVWGAAGVAAAVCPAPAAAAAGVVGFALGAAVGSFLTQAAYRVPRGLSLDDPPSSCPACGHQLSRRDNIPLLGWVLLCGRCRECGERISWRYPAVELATAAVGAAVAAVVVSSW